MFKSWKMAGGVSCLMALMVGCSTPTPQPGPQPVNETHNERCYKMDSAEEEAIGRAKVEEGVQFYYHLNCDQEVEAENDGGSGGSGEVPDWIDDREEGVEKKAVADSKATEGDNKAGAVDDKAESDNLTDSKESAAKEKAKETSGNGKKGDQAKRSMHEDPTCYFDKMTAGRGDIPPCGEEFYDENPHLR